MCGEDLTAKIPLLAPLPPHIPVEGDIEVGISLAILSMLTASRAS
jgi:hypothetical protein